VSPSITAVRAVARLARLLEQACDELNPAHYRVLAAVASGERRASRVAQRLALGKPTVSSAVAALTERGLLARGDDADDRRAGALTLTADGEAVLARVETARVARLDSVAALLPPGLVAALAGLDPAIDEVRAQ
jgi:DNA-binding MarR family transcriptional regulator